MININQDEPAAAKTTPSAFDLWFMFDEGASDDEYCAAVDLLP